MSEFDVLENYFIYFLFGFLATKIWQRIVPSENLKTSEIYLDILAYGVFFKFIYDFLYKIDIGIFIKDIKYNVSLIITLILTGIVPFLLSKILNWKCFLNIFVKTKDPSSWDFFFSKRQCCLVIVYLKGNEIPIVGYYGEKSFASSYPYTNDIYLEAVYNLNEDKTIGEVKQDSLGIIIKESEIERIEFRNI